MATYNQVSYGSKGSDVTELQKLLNQNGYKLDTDGIFGSKTQAAVKDYQQKNNLSVDGIAGENTWGALTRASGTATTDAAANTATQSAKAPTFEYKPSDTVSQAQAMLDQQLAQKPGAYTSQWQTQLNDAIQKILNREQFSYDLNGDALYQQYKDQYMAQGKMAMMDTMGQAQAMTGGYGNSYAQSVGQQAYQEYLQQLNEKIPELYQLALSKYQMEGDALADQYAILAQQEDQDYGRYNDLLSQWQTERDYLSGRYDAERDYDYGRFADDRVYAYQQERDEVADKQWQAEFDEAKRQYDQQYAAKYGSGSNSSSNPGKEKDTDPPTPTGYDNGSLGEYEIKRLQKELGVTQNGKWGPESQAAALAKWGVTSADEAGRMYRDPPRDDSDKLTYSDVALTASQMRQKGASKNDIYQYISSVINSSNYIPTNSAEQDLAELRSGYVGSGR